MLLLTEAGSKRRASLHLVRGRGRAGRVRARRTRAARRASTRTFVAALRAARTTRSSARSPIPRLFSGIGNAYSDEILHRARLSPLAAHRAGSRRRTPRGSTTPPASVLVGMDRAAPRRGDGARGSPRRSPPSGRGWRCTGGFGSPVPSAGHRSSGSGTPRTRPTTVRAARPKGGCWPTGACHGSCERTGPGAWRSWRSGSSREPGPGFGISAPGIAWGTDCGHIYKSMSDGRFAILDPAAGISGDMLLGALVAAGAPAEWLQGLPPRLGLPDVTRGHRRGGPLRCARDQGRRPAARTAARRRPSRVWSHAPHTTIARIHHEPVSHAPHRHVGELIADGGAGAAVGLGARARRAGVPAAGRGRGKGPRRAGGRRWPCTRSARWTR